MERQKLLKNIYTNIRSPGGYTGVNALLKEAKQHDNGIKKKDVVYFLEGQRTYGLFKPRRLRYQKSTTIPSGYMSDMQADLAGKYNLILIQI